MNQLESLLILNMVEGLGARRIKALLKYFGSPEKILSTRSDTLKNVPDIGGVLAGRIASCRAEINLKREFVLIKKHQVEVITLFDRRYPAPLKEIYDPPPVLYVRGRLTPSDRNAIAVVGSRRSSFYGMRTTERLAAELSAYQLTVVSGMARGIDSAAHQGALKAGGRTIAVLGCGLSRVYPPENKKLAEDIAGSGALISEFPMSAPPERGNFPRRNRVISGLSRGVIVVEAAKRSGALITVNFALEQGREIFAVPGNVGSATSQGTNELIRQGAKLVENAGDIIEEIWPLLGEAKKLSSASAVPVTPHLEGDEESIYEILDETPRSAEELIKRSAISPSAVSSVLSRLEIKGLIRQLPGKMFCKK